MEETDPKASPLPSTSSSPATSSSSTPASTSTARMSVDSVEAFIQSIQPIENAPPEPAACSTSLPDPNQQSADDNQRHPHADNDAADTFAGIHFPSLVFYGDAAAHLDPNTDNFPFFNASQNIDFPFITTVALPEKLHLKENVDYFNLLNRTAPLAEVVDPDIPEYIDINSLVIPSHCFPLCPEMPEVKLEPFADEPDEKTDDVDVVFVKEYKCDTPDVAKRRKVLPSPTTEPPGGVVPRRNPKRQVQMQKLPYDSCCEGRRCRDPSSNCTSTSTISTRRSGRSTGAVFSPPASLKPADFKEWPVDGMHEKPTFNPVTKKLEKLPTTTRKPKSSTPSGKKRPPPSTSSSSTSSVSTPSTAPARRSKKTKQGVSEFEAKRSFATMTHHNLHYILSYVNGVKEYNTLMGKENCAPYLQDNVIKAGGLLTDACLLYCLANDVSESSLAKYLNAVNAQENVTEFLDCVVDGCDAHILR